MDIKKHIKFFIIVAYIVLAYFLITLVMPKTLGLFLPFIAAFILAAIANPVSSFLKTKWKFPKFLATAVSLLLIVFVLSGIITLAVNRIISELTSFAQNIPKITSTVTDTYYYLTDKWELFQKSVSPEIYQYVMDFAGELADTAKNLVASLTKITISSATNVATSIPGVLIFIVALVLSSIFITNDYSNIKSFILMQFPENAKNKLLSIKKYTAIAFKKYIKGMLIIMAITFVEVLTGLCILRVEYAFTAALLIAFIDVLPIFGAGAVLIPWGIISLITGNFSFGIGVLVLYGIITVIRQFIEPKIISNSLGTHPLLTLVGIYVGYKLFGIIGMILTPVIVLVLTSLHKAGIIKIWKNEQ
ncbi:MAG: sporulation integral membrane protein YtvI [Clostridia bacterium]|nr:sporulation integral membrane protein YtvI [Clostridia bacterium]